ncbi:MAG: SRPBCC domain-containing protein [Actinobacteria bacterium]|nr:SRPBCC domain-containing protein [Actinomycetota bacterium]
MSVNADQAIRKSIVVGVPPEAAWSTYTERIGEWWPLATYSIHGERARTALFEGGQGGRLYERTASGEEAHWAEILAWEPPSRLVLLWQVNPERPATEVEIRFVSEGDGTRVEVEHRGWERLGDAAEEARASYESGWDTVLAPYVEAAAR